MTDGLDPLSETIGGLKADVKALMRSLGQEREMAADHRKELRATVSEIKRIVEPLARDVEDMKPVVRELKALHLQRQGGRKMLKQIGHWWHVLSVAVGAVLVYLGQQLSALLHLGR